jgi:hypothetical protein
MLLLHRRCRLRFFGRRVLHQDQIFFSSVVLVECFAFFFKVKCRLVLFSLSETTRHIKRLFIISIDTSVLVIKDVWFIYE